MSVNTSQIQKFSIQYSTISRRIFSLLLVATIVDVGGGAGIKYAVTTIFVVWSFWLFIFNGLHRKAAVEFGLILLILISGFYSIVIGVEPKSAVSVLTFSIYLLAFHVLMNFDADDLVSIFVRTSVFGSILVIIVFFAILVLPSLAPVWAALSEEYRLGYFGVQLIGGFTIPVVYFRWSMWLIPAFILAVGQRRGCAVVIGVAVLFTMSTAIILFTSLGFLLVRLLESKRWAPTYRGLVFMTFSLIVITTMALVFSDVVIVVLQELWSKVSGTSESTGVKLGHIEGALSAANESWRTVFFGTGAGSEFFSPGVDRFTIRIEASHFNLLRQFGLLGVIVWFGYTFFTVSTSFVCGRTGKRLSIGLLMIFCAAGTNPLLLSPIYVMYIAICRAYAEQHPTKFSAAR